MEKCILRDLIKNKSLYKINDNEFLYILSESYFYKTEAYYEIIERENASERVLPSSMDVLEAYVVPICLKKAEMYGIPVMECKISNSYAPIPSIVYGINYYADPSTYLILKDKNIVADAIKRVTCNGKYPFCYQKISSWSDIIECRSVFGIANIDIDEIRSLTEAIYRIFRLPLMKILFIKHNNEWRLSSIMPITYKELNSMEYNYLYGALKDQNKEGLDKIRSDLELSKQIRDLTGYIKNNEHGSQLGFFVDRSEISNSEKLNSLIKFRDVAEDLGYRVYFIFPVEIEKIYMCDGLFIRSRTDPMNISFVASKMAEFYGIPVIDDPRSIQICSDKINMYYHLMRAKIPIPKTVILKKSDLKEDCIQGLFKELGRPIVLKEPSTSFSRRVERVYSPEEFMKVAKRYIKLSDRIVAQEYIESKFDWRIGVLNGEFLYGCKYIIPSETFKIQASINGHIVYCAVESVPKEEIPNKIIELGIDASNAIGRGLYGVDIKECGDSAYVIEVNDNPSLEAGELNHYPEAYQKIINTIMRGRQ